MKTIYKLLILLIFVTFSAQISLAAEEVAESLVMEDTEKPSDTQKAFAEKLVKITRGSDVSAFWELVHPESLECLEEEFKEITELMNFKPMTEAPLPDDYDVAVIPLDPSEIREFFTNIFGPEVMFPVEPTHSMVLNYSTRTGSCHPTEVSKIIYIATHDDGQWYEAMPCRTAMLLSPVVFKNMMKAQEDAVAKTYDVLSEEIKEKLRKMVIDENRKVEAVQLLSEEEGLELELSSEIVKEICRRN